MQNNDLITPIIYLLCTFIFFILYISSALYTYNDANTRGKSGCLWALIVWFTWPLGLIAYFLLRDQEVKL